MSDQVPVERDTKFDFSGSSLTGFIKSINGDTTAAQLMNPSAQIVIDNVANSRTFRLQHFVPAVATPAGPPPIFTPVPPGVMTPILSLVIPLSGWYFPCAFVQSELGIPGTMVSLLRFTVNATVYQEHTYEDTIGLTIDQYSKSFVATPVAFTIGDVVALFMQHDAAAPFNVGAVLSMARIGDL